ncbi:MULTISPECIES: small multi-drug export protein [unclassified Methanoregula]|uniref:small multi-drug export protein n=1 Tax=unclassified Methanoregula TaxID=2649730 RepID=UPI0009D5BF9A|nr:MULTISPECIES: small multi-drug export protein [unclassified Methanoregula]OPX62589.1 MAG: hypothetical protein A4E33_02217 [Methanoregula sp. PtaB.Bin085]OPY34841.1 MAG: hypothetical protein A4E34_01204 [Methanoregula sp. PtaU1.Bin006]
MEDTAPGQPSRTSAGILIGCAAVTLALPVPAAIVTGRSVPVTLALVGSAFVIEYGAAPVGILGGLDPLFVLFALSCIALGITLLLFGLCGTLEERWPRFARFLERTRAKVQGSTILAKYGVYGLVPLVMILGFWVCAPAACISGWRRDLATVLIMTGYIIACIVTILATQGAIGILTP